MFTPNEIRARTWHKWSVRKTKKTLTLWRRMLLFVRASMQPRSALRVHTDQDLLTTTTLGTT